MTKTDCGTWKHKGWDIAYFGNWYRMTRLNRVNGKIIAKTASNLKQAATIIDNEEAKIKYGKEGNTMSKKWNVEYDHKDGRKGTIEVRTEVEESNGFQYGNGKSGALFIGGSVHGYDLRYNKEKDLHMAMIKEYFGKGLVKATEI